jgi:uncharacterized protein YdhG (YjbR/CyaY superfamily)
MRPRFESVDQYIASFPQQTQEVLNKIRQTIHSVMPEADQVISYNIPTFKVGGKYVVYFAGYDKHVSVYPVHQSTLDKELAPYLSGKGTAKFPLDKPIPYDLIKKVAKDLLQGRLEL